MANQFARRLRPNPTDAEKCLWYRLRRRQLDGLRFRRQAPIGRYVVDFACHSARLVVEVDGGQHAASDDAARDVEIGRHGYRVIRFWNNEVLGNIDGVIEMIRRAAGSPPS